MRGGGGCEDNQCSRQCSSGAGNAWPFSSGRRPNIPHATRSAPRRLHRGPEILRRIPAAVAARRPALPCLEGPASCRESRRGSALHVAPPGVRRRMPPQPSRSPRRRCPQGCCRRRRGRWARTRPAARNWVSKSSQGRRACGGQESVQSGGPYRRAGRGGSSPPPSPVTVSTGVGDSPTLPELGSLVTIGSFSVASPSLLRQRINGWGIGRRNSRDGEASPSLLFLLPFPCAEGGEVSAFYGLTAHAFYSLLRLLRRFSARSRF